MKKLLMSDYDNTFYKDYESLKINIDRIKELRDNGNLFAIVTGRSYDRIKEEIDKYGIGYDYLSCVDGSVLYDKNDNLLKSYYIDKRICYNIKEIIDNKIDIKMSILHDNINGDVIECYYDVTNYDNIDLLVDVVKKVISKYSFLGMELIDFGVDKLLIIKRKNITKKNAGIDIAFIENVLYDNVYCIGDNYNDLEMIKYFNGYAVKDCESVLIDSCLWIYDNVSDLVDDIMLNKVYTKKRG